MANKKSLEEKLTSSGKEIVENMRRYHKIISAITEVNRFRYASHFLSVWHYCGYYCEEHYLTGVQMVRGNLSEYYKIPEEFRKYLDINKGDIKKNIRRCDGILNEARKRQVYPGWPSPGAI